MIVPTNGASVYYTPDKSDPLPADQRGRCMAHIVFVHNERLVNLTVADIYGNTYARLSVPLLQEGDTAPIGGGYCEWPASRLPVEEADRPTSEAPGRQLRERTAGE